MSGFVAATGCTGGMKGIILSAVAGQSTETNSISMSPEEKESATACGNIETMTACPLLPGSTYEKGMARGNNTFFAPAVATAVGVVARAIWLSI